MFSAKMVALAMALWAGSEAKRAKVLEDHVQTHESDKRENEADSDVDVVQTRDDREGSEDRSHAEFTPIDANPIGAGTIAGSHGLLVMVFGDGQKGDKQGIKVKDLRRIELDRRFPKGYKYGGPLRSNGRVDSASRRRHIMTDRTTNAKVLANINSINWIICPFLSTLMNEGALKLKQRHTRAELTQAVVDSGLDREIAMEHVADNFLNNAAGGDNAEFDIWNLEGETDEHVTSTGINDCATAFKRCNNARANPPKQSCNPETTRTCRLPNRDKFSDFVQAVVRKKWDENTKITIQKLNAAFR